MNHRRLLPTLLLTALLPATAARAQATPTASRSLELSAFGAVSGVYTGLSSGRNLSIVAGADVGLSPWHGVRPQLEVRGLYPLDKGTIDSQKSILAGLRADFLLNHRLRPYGDFLFGRGDMRFGANGYFFGPAIYIETTTNIYSPGGGFDYDLTRHLSVKVDAQFQRWGEAPTPTGNIWSTLGTAGIVYRFNSSSRSLPYR